MTGTGSVRSTRTRRGLRAYGLLAKGALAAELRRGWTWTVAKHVVAPVAAICFAAFVGADVATDDRWPRLAIALVIWLCFANSFVCAGLALRRERGLVEGGPVPGWLLVSSAIPLVVLVFVVQLAVLQLALELASAGERLTVGVLVPAVIAGATGVGLGMLVARLCTIRPGVTALVPWLLATSLVATPVLYAYAAHPAPVWCGVNPICAASVTAASELSDSSSPLPSGTYVAALAVSVALVVWGFVAARPRRRRSPGDLDASLAFSGVGTRAPGGGRLSRARSDLWWAAGLGSRRSARPPVLHDVDLTLSPGEIVVVVGTGGSGQDALLALAAHRRAPATGDVEARYPTGALVAPLAGTHSALSGFDNIKLWAMLHGRSSSDAVARADGVLTFTELTGIARARVSGYSHDACVRLGFGLMALLDARILVWDDDVLAGSPVFRQKCMALIPQLLAEGRSILMASSDVGKVVETSRRAVWIDEGRIRMDGPSELVLAQFLAPHVSPGPPDPPDAIAGRCRIVRVQLCDEAGLPAREYVPGATIVVALDLEIQGRIEQPYLLVSIATPAGSITSASMFTDGDRPDVLEGRVRAQCRFEDLVLAPAHEFTVRFAMYERDGTTIVVPKRVVASFRTGGLSDDAARPDRGTRILGAPPVLTRHSWSVAAISSGDETDGAANPRQQVRSAPRVDRP